jgi:hypothetical protein
MFYYCGGVWHMWYHRKVSDIFLWLLKCMTYVVSILAVASYYCIMFILVMSIWLEPGRWENHITILECSWVRSVRKLYNYYRVLLWIMSLTYGHDRTSIASYFARGGIPYWYSIVLCSRRDTMQLQTLLGMEAVDMHMHYICTLWGLLVLIFYVGMKWRQDYCFYYEYYFIRMWRWFIYCISCRLFLYENFIGHVA